MTTPLLKTVVNRHRLILANIIENPQSGLVLVGLEGVVQSIRDHLVRPILEGEELACVVVA